MMDRKSLFAVVFVLVAVFCAGSAFAQGQIPLPGNKIPQFVDPLPLLSVVAGGTMETITADDDEITLNMHEFQAYMMPSTFVPASGLPYTGTWVFGYREDLEDPPTTAVDTYVGPVIVARRGTPTQIRYVNNLTANNIAWRLWTDQSLHSAFHQAVDQAMPASGDTNHYMGPVLAVPHLHGGEVPAVIDGGPEAWFASNVAGPDTDTTYTAQGPAYYTHPGVAAAANEAVYRYPNTQEAAPLWFHDHLLGGTRLNATFAGLAGAYALIDPTLSLPGGLHPVGLQRGTTTDYLIPLVIQDRMFDTNGQLFFPNVGVNPEHPYWVPEFVGDVIVVNGKVWPYLNVDRQRYRFFIINGSNSRPYDMYLQDLTSRVKGPRMWVIATDGGYLDTPVLIDPNATGQQTAAGTNKSLMMMPGERYEIIIDFNDSGWVAAEQKAYKKKMPNRINLVLRNTGPTVDGNPKQSTEGRVMQFRVLTDTPDGDTSYDPASGTPIRSGSRRIVRLPGAPGGPAITDGNVQKTRLLTLNEVPGGGGPLEALVNNSKWGGLRPDMAPISGSTLVNGNYLTEFPNEGDVEVWEIVNLTMDSHPIHLHAVQFQLIDRQPFDVNAYMTAYNGLFPGSTSIIDPMTGLGYAPGVFIPGYGPPLAYSPSMASGDKYGGNPDVAPYLLGMAAPPLSFEAGWKDTVIMHPGERTRIAVRWGPQDVPLGTTATFAFKPDAPINPEASTEIQIPGVYVWHCHITDHEDNEMMRPDVVVSDPATAREYNQVADY